MNSISKMFLGQYTNTIRQNNVSSELGINNLNELGTVQRQVSTTAYSPTTNEVNFEEYSAAPFLQIDSRNNLSIEKNQVYGIETDYGLINYKFHNTPDTRYAETLYFDNQISDAKRVQLEKKRQFLSDLQSFSDTGKINALYTARDAIDVRRELENLGINTEEPFTINNKPTRYRMDPSGVLHDVDLESKTMREKDWRRYGHDEDTLFIIQGKEYRMNEDGRLPLPEDYVHKYEQVQVIKNK